jgi:hypothetical protein
MDWRVSRPIAQRTFCYFPAAAPLTEVVHNAGRNNAAAGDPTLSGRYGRIVIRIIVVE